MVVSNPWPQEWVPPADLPLASVEDGREYHQVLFHDGDLSRPRGWHHDNVAHLLELTRPFLHAGAVGLDYATGTGGSALPLLEDCAARELNIELALTDVMPSWFFTAHTLLHEHPGTHFFLLDLKKPRPLHDTFGEARFDFIVSASTIHLLPPKKLTAVFQDLHSLLRPGGALIFNTGDVDHPGRLDTSAALLHDVYRIARDLLHEDSRYQAILGELAERDPDAHSRVVKGHQVFPAPFSCSFLGEALAEAGFEEEHREFRVIDKAKQDALDFIQVERLTGIAGAVQDTAERRALIAEFMDRSLEELARRGQFDGENIRTSWIFGVYRRGL
ncbi:MAG: class I SAM-dependent methyltransferase [Planctomycetota bacterium]|jgi:SAM-dependent methyltransferase